LAQFRSTADLLDLILRNGGEVTNGNSPYESDVLSFLNQVHFAVIAGGTIPIGKDQTAEIDEVWPWAKSRTPLVIELQPKYDTGTVTLTQGSEAGVFSSAPSFSVEGWHFTVEGAGTVYKIASHTAASTNFELDSAYTDDTGTVNFQAMKLEYDLVPSFITINASNNKFQFQKVAGTDITATLTFGSYSPADLATHVASVATTAAAGPVITGSYSSTTRLFTFTSDLAGATIFRIQGAGSQSPYSVHKNLGFDDELTSSATSFTSTYILGGIARLVEPMKVQKGSSIDGSIYGIDSESFQRNYPVNQISEETPSKFFVMHEGSDGALRVRFNAYPAAKTRIEIERVEVPRDLKDNAYSMPLLPRKDAELLQFAATFFLMANKSDDRAQLFASLTQGKLKAMIAAHRGGLVRAGEKFGQTTPRLDKIGYRRRGINTSGDSY